MKNFTSNRVMLSLVTWLLTLTAVLAQGIRGKVMDATTKVAIPGATIVVAGTNVGATTDANGDYTLKVAAGTYTLRVSFVGYETLSVPVTVADNETAEANASLKETSSALTEVVVIGSRSTAARTNINTPAPVDVITTKEMKSFAQVELGQILNYVAPSFSSNRQTISDGSDHIDQPTLRGLTQVLVLVNGKRRHMSSLVNVNGSVGRGSVPTDLSAIPVAAIERIEVLRDGAAAQYGSDAIAGVINVVLKKNYNGLAASLTAGQNMTTMNYTVPNINGSLDSKSQSIVDGQTLQFDISKGLRLGKAGYLNVSGQYLTRGRTNRSADDNVPTEYLGVSGGFPTTPTGQDQTTFRQTLLANDAAVVKKNGYDRHNMIIGNSSSQNISIFANGGIPLGEKSEFYFTGGLSFKDGKSYGNARIPVSRSQQPFLANGTMQYPNGFLPGIESNITDQSLSFGYKTKFRNSWTFDVSNTSGANQFRYTIFNSGNATLNTGQNKFNAGTMKFLQNTTNVDLARNFPDLGSFKYVNLALGGEFRIDNYQLVAGEEASYSGSIVQIPLAPYTDGGASPGTTTALPGSQVFPGFQPTSALNKSRNNQSFYVDVESEIGKLLVDVAGRYEHYSDFGSTVNGKIATRLQLIDGLALRGAASTGFRAPTLQERYFNNISTLFTNGLPSNTLIVNNDSPVRNVTVGAAPLTPEKSVNLSLGLTARIARQLTLTIDAYQIQINNRIIFSGQYTASQLGITDPSINRVAFFANAVDTRTKGIDIVATEKLAMGKGNLTLSAALNFNESKVLTVNGTPKIDDPANNNPANNPAT